MAAPGNSITWVVEGSHPPAGTVRPETILNMATDGPPGLSSGRLMLTPNQRKCREHIDSRMVPWLLEGILLPGHGSKTGDMQIGIL